jgi:hypothetical protein
MPTARKLLAGLALALTAVSCSDNNNSPTAPAATDNQTPSAPTAPTTRAKQALTGDVAPDQTFIADGTGSLTAGTAVTVAAVQITHFAYENGQLFVDGGLYAPNGTLISAFSHAPATLSKGGSPTSPVCPILDLDIGAIHLDLLGLVVDLAPVHLNINAESGSGNLLGNLLCAVAGLLDGPSPLSTAITNLLNSINALLQGLLGSLTL